MGSFTPPMMAVRRRTHLNRLLHAKAWPDGET
jgi:hypothetical protein